MSPYFISCTTCQARLRVTNDAIAGQIVPCPKCGSMVLVSPPPAPAPTTPVHDPEASKDTQPAIAAPDLSSLPAGTGEEAAPAGSPASAPSPVSEPSSGDPLSARLRRVTLLTTAGALGIVMAITVFHLFARKSEPTAQRQADTPTLTTNEGSSVDQTPVPPAVPSAENPEASPSPLPDNTVPSPAPATEGNPSSEAPVNPPRAPGEPAAPAPDGTPTSAPNSPPPETAEAPTKKPKVPVAATREDALAPPGFEGPEKPAAQLASARPLDSLKQFSAFMRDRPEPAVAPATSGELPHVSSTGEIRPVVNPVDVDARLSDPLAGIEFKEIALLDFLRFMTNLSTIPVTLPPETLLFTGLSAQVPVAVRQTNTTVEAVLNEVLQRLELNYQSRDGQMFVWPAAWLQESAGEEMDVADLVGAINVDELARIVRTCVAPLSWEAPGTELRAEGGKLFLSQEPVVVYQVIVLLDQLRVARGLRPVSARSAVPHKAPRFRLAETHLSTPITLKIFPPAPLVQVLRRLEGGAGVRFLVNWEGLAEAHWGTDCRASLAVEGLPLREVLSSLLGPMDLGWRVIDETTIEISSLSQLSRTGELEVYALRGLDAAKPKAEEVTATVREALQSAAAMSDSPIGLYFDVPSGSLFAYLSQENQRRLAELLERMRGDEN